MTEKQAEELVRKNLEDYLHRMGHFPDNAGRYHCIAPDHKDGNPSMTLEKNGKYAKCWSHPQPRDTFNIFDAINMLEGIRSLHAQKKHAFAIYQIVIDEVAPDKAVSDKATPAKNHHARTDASHPVAEETTETIGPVTVAAVSGPEIANPIDTQILEAVPENVEVRSADDFIEIIEFGAVGQIEPTIENPSSLADAAKSPDPGASVEVIPEAEPVPVEVNEPVPVEMSRPGQAVDIELVQADAADLLVENKTETDFTEAVFESENVQIVHPFVEVIEPSFVEMIESPVEVTAEVEIKDEFVELAREVEVTEPEPVAAEAASEPETNEAEPEPVPEVAEPEMMAAIPTLVDRIEATCMADFLDEVLAADQANTSGLSLPPAIPSGFTALDKYLDGGFYPGLYLFCSRPGEGKTTFSLQIADAIAAQGMDVLLISMDLSRVELAAKSISRLTLLMDHTIARNQAKTLRQVLDVSDRKTGAEFGQSYLSQVMHTYRQTAGHLHVLEMQARLSPNDVHKLIDRHIARTTTRPVVILDSLQHLQPMESGQTETVQADSAVRALMQISRSAGTPIIALSSVIRDNYGSDVVLSLQLEPAAGTLAAPHHLDVKLLKNRHGAIDGKVRYNYYAAYNYFEEM